MSKDTIKLKVLNIAQPNAHHIFHDGKNVENRSGPVHIRGTIAIYASATKRPKWIKESGYEEDELTFGAIVGFVDLVDCINEDEVTAKTKKWFVGDIGYVLKNPRLLKKPIKVRPPVGAVTWWTLKGSKAKECYNQIKASSYITPYELEAKDRKKFVRKNSRLRTPSKALSKIIGPEDRKIKDMVQDLCSYLNKNKLGFKKENDKTVYVKADRLLRPIFKKKEIREDELWDVVEGTSKLILPLPAR